MVNAIDKLGRSQTSELLQPGRRPPNCQACHSLDYIPMNSPFPNAALWDAEITKMIKAYGAPIDDGDAKAIAEYLKKNYGSQ